MNKPKLTINQANELRRQYQNGSSINSLSRHYDLPRNSVKAILRGETYNKSGEHENLMEKSSINTLF